MNLKCLLVAFLVAGLTRATWCEVLPDSTVYHYEPSLISVKLSVLYHNAGFNPSEFHSGDFLSFRPLDFGERLKGESWFLIRIENPTVASPELILEIVDKKVLVLNFFKVGGKELIPLVPPHATAQTQRPFKTSRHRLQVEIGPGANTFLLNVVSTFSFSPGIVLWSARVFDESNAVSRSIYGPYYGAMGFMLVFSLFLAIVFSRERIYTFYAVYIAAMITMFVAVNGFGVELVWIDNSLIDYEVIVGAGAVSLLAFCLFAKEFFRNSSNPRNQRILTRFSYLFVVNILWSVVMYNSKLLQALNFLIFTVIIQLSFFIYIGMIAIRSYRKGFSPGLFIAVAVVFLFTGMSMNYLRLLEVVPDTVLTSHSLQLGNLLEMITLTLGIAFWFKNQYDERRDLESKVSFQQLEMAKEKERIARDLHDNIGSQLSMVSMDLARLSKEPGIESSRIHKLQESMTETLVELRDTIWAINRDRVTREELEDKINTFLWRLRQGESAIEYKFDVSNDWSSGQLRPTHAVNIFRIVQEAVTNARRHSRATEILVGLSAQSDCINVRISDNGTGFNEAGKQNEHYGLENMRKRADEIEARFELVSLAGKGTDVRLSIPLN